MKVLAISLEYGDPLPPECGYYDHPIEKGMTAALQVRDVVEFEDDESAISWGIEVEKDPMVYQVTFQAA